MAPSSGEILVIGIDPSLTATGMVAIGARRQTPPAAGHEVNVFARFTIKPPRNGPLAERLAALRLGVRVTLRHMIALRLGSQEWWVVSEDPTDFTAIAGKKFRSTESIAKLGAATGVVLAGAYELLSEMENGTEHLVTFGTKEWLPKTRNKHGGSHFVDHDLAVQLLRRCYPQLADSTEHETMAAGVAMHHARRVLDNMARRQGPAA